MPFIRHQNKLTFTPSEQPSDDEIAFDAMLKTHQYTLQAQGAAMVIFRDLQKVAHFNAYDGSFFLHSKDACDNQLAALFGTKRFLMPAGANKPEGAQMFARDRDFDLTHPIPATPLAEGLTVTKTKHFSIADYKTLLSLYIRCADYTPAKQEEYSANGHEAGMYLRFNSDNDLVQVFLKDAQQKIIGAASAYVHKDKDAQGHATFYIFDEVVDYESGLSVEQIQQIGALKAAIKSGENAEAQQTTLSAIIEPERDKLLPLIFEALRKEINHIAPDAKGFIRVASGREAQYEKLNCRHENAHNFVVHGPANKTLRLQLDACMRAWALSSLQSNHPRVSATSPFAASSAAALMPSEGSVAAVGMKI